MNLLEYFKISNTIAFKEGEIYLMEQYANVIPTSILCDFEKGLIASSGFAKSYETLYDVAKKISFEYNLNYFKKHKFQSIHEMCEWQIKIITLAGWGKWAITKLNLEEKSVVLRINSSPFPTVFGKSSFPVDILATGLVCGGAMAVLGSGLDAVETSCEAMGDSYCQIEVGPTDIILKKKEKLWDKLNL